MFDLMKTEKISPKSFAELTKEFQKLVNDNETGSILCVVYQKGKLAYCNKFGWKDKKKNIPIEFDDIFRIYSMTKPIVCLAALILYDEGKFDLDDPLEKYLPEYKSLKVLKSYNEETGEVELEEAKERITIKHLFTHTSGLSYGFYPGVPIDKLYGEKFEITSENRIKAVLESFQQLDDLEKFSRSLATLPLAFEPGSHFWYAWGIDILGLLIEKLSGRKLDLFLKESVFDKLGMKDTDFYVPDEKQNRFVKAYTKDNEGNLIEVEGILDEGFYLKPKFLSGGGGLVSTLEDYLRFSLMMLNKGKYNDVRIISKDVINLMISNHLPKGKDYLDMQLYEFEDPEIIKRNKGFGFGLGVIVKIAENMLKSGIGDYGWGGAFDTIFRIDPINEVIFIVLTQYCPVDNNWIAPIETPTVSDLVYDALGIYTNKE